MGKRVRAHWCVSNNFGDAISIWLIQKITGEIPIFTEIKSGFKKFVVGGSILNWCDRDCVVWGAGIANVKDEISPYSEILAVRGPLTKDRLMICRLDCREIPVGDPVLLAPQFYSPNQEKKFVLGIIPHYVNQAEVYNSSLAGRSDVLIINVFDEIEKVIDQVASCRSILSSSLHGLIIADVYNVPSRWMEGAVKLGGDSFKFRDYFASVSIPVYEPAKFHEVAFKGLDEIVTMIGSYRAKINVDALWNVCPFK